MGSTFAHLLSTWSTINMLFLLAIMHHHILASSQGTTPNTQRSMSNNQEAQVRSPNLYQVQDNFADKALKYVKGVKTMNYALVEGVIIQLYNRLDWTDITNRDRRLQLGPTQCAIGEVAVESWNQWSLRSPCSSWGKFRVMLPQGEDNWLLIFPLALSDTWVSNLLSLVPVES